MNIINWNRKLKWNVSVMVILILLACSLMGILTIIFLRSLIIYTDDSYGYYKSYYMAKAGLELALTEIDNTDVWFQNSVNSWDAIVVNNFGCPWCNFTSEIKWRSGFIWNYFWKNNECSDEQKLSIPAWWSMVLPMFYDNSSNFSELISYSKCLSWNECENLYKDRMYLSIQWWNEQDNLNIWVIFLDEEGNISLEYLLMSNKNVDNNMFFEYFKNFSTYYQSDEITIKTLLPYIVLSNPGNNEVKFCITNSSTSDWTTTRYFVSSIWEYMWKTVWLQAIYEQPVPSFLINPYLWLWW